MARLVPQFRRRPTLHTVPATTAEEPLARHLFFADRVVALSQHGVQQLRSLGVENVKHIPTAIGVQRWASLQGKAAYFKEQLGLNDRPTLLYPGHYSPGYGADVLLEALPLIAQEVPDVQVIFACRPRTSGDAEREKEARRTLQEAGLAHNARFYSVVNDMQLLIGAADLTVLPLETMRDKVDIPTTLLESLAAAKPIVISDLAPMNEVIEEGGAGIGRLVPPGDAQALAENVIALLLDGGERESIGRCGQSLMFERYDIKAVAKQYADLYRKMTA
jgi:glycosyltransferase involved in cell wall biosynthesis